MIICRRFAGSNRLVGRKSTFRKPYSGSRRATWGALTLRLAPGRDRTHDLLENYSFGLYESFGLKKLTCRVETVRRPRLACWIFHCPQAVHSGTAPPSARWPAGPAQVRVGGQEVYTLAEVAALTGLSRQTVTRIFEREKGVLILARPESLHKRRYRSIRIPRVVFERVLNRMTAK
jgi:AraC-like DNA-binding protein